MTSNVPRAPIKSAAGYFRAIETLDRIYKGRRQRRSRADEETAHTTFLGLVVFDGKFARSQEDALIKKLEKRIFAYLDSLSDEKRDQLKKSSRV